MSAWAICQLHMMGGAKQVPLSVCLLFSSVAPQTLGVEEEAVVAVVFGGVEEWRSVWCWHRPRGASRRPVQLAHQRLLQLAG